MYCQIMPEKGAYERCLREQTSNRNPRVLRGLSPDGRLCAEGYCTAQQKYRDFPSAYASGYGVQVCQGAKPPIRSHSDSPREKRTPPSRAAAAARREGLTTWFAEKWVNVCEVDAKGKHPPCGRPSATTTTTLERFPYCRPSRRTAKSGRSKTASEMTAQEKRRLCETKRGLEEEEEKKNRRMDRVVVEKKGGRRFFWPNMELVDKYNKKKKKGHREKGDWNGKEVTFYRPESLEGVKGAGRHKLRVFVPDDDPKKKKAAARGEKLRKAKEIRFGHNGYEDYTIHRDPERRKNYCNRSAGIKCDEKECTESSPNFWSRMVLWDC